jgi:hypothetical protein
MPAIPATHSVTGDVLTIAGIIIPPSGSGDFVSYTYPDSISAYVGNDGQSVRAISPDDSATVAITVGAYSVAHKRLAELYRQQRAAGVAFQGVPYLHRRTNGSTVASPSAWIQAAPSDGSARDAGDLTWTLHLASVTRDYAAAVVG